MAKTKSIGNLDQRITIEANTPSRESDGGEISSWSTVATVWASVDYGNSVTMDSEKFEADQNTAVDRVIFTIRHRSDVNKKMRVLFGSEYYDIVAINRSQDRNKYLELVAQGRE